MSVVQRTSFTEVCCAGAASVAGAVRPGRSDPTRIADITDAGLPAATAHVRLIHLPQTPKAVLVAFIAEAVWRPWRVRVAMRSFVIEHPRARILVDPSICEDVRPRVLAEYSPLLRASVMPPPGTLSTTESLARVGLSAEDIDFALPTHLHWDHVCGLLDMPQLSMTVHRVEHEWLTASSTRPIAGVRPALANREISTFSVDGGPVLTFTASHDLMGDGSIVLVDLAGHTPGSVGILLATERGPILLAGDSVWHSVQIERRRQKPAFPGRLVDEDRAAALSTIDRLAALDRRLLIIPTHDHDAG